MFRWFCICLPPGTFGTVKGTVSGLEACDVNPAPLEGATVNFWQSGAVVYTTTTLASGYYTYTVPEGTYDLEVVAAVMLQQSRRTLRLLVALRLPRTLTCA
jgi:hypothetical protein